MRVKSPLEVLMSQRMPFIAARSRVREVNLVRIWSPTARVVWNSPYESEATESRLR